MPMRDQNRAQVTEDVFEISGTLKQLPQDNKK